MYAQSTLIAESLARLRAQTPGTADSYFVGFAGDASQDVFAKEVAYVQGLWDDHYDGEGRSLRLINNASTAGTLPIASITNLRLALRHIGGLMDSEEDVLVLFLTSHGAENFELAVNFAPMALNPLTPALLKGYLDESKIKWRLIVVSACYSGGYIPALRNPYTVIITAAAADRTSFGCDTARDFTYFGEAYFRDEVARGVSVLQAFVNAEANIKAREVKEGLTPSQPQLYIGDEIAARLPVWELAWRQRRALPIQ